MTYDHDDPRTWTGWQRTYRGYTALFLLALVVWAVIVSVAYCAVKLIEAMA